MSAMEAARLPLSTPVISGVNTGEATRRRRSRGCAVSLNNGGWNMQHRTAKGSTLSFTQALGQGTQLLKPVICLEVPKSASVDRGSRLAVTARAPYTERQESLVKETWKELKKDAGNHALAMFLRVFEVAPSAKRLFSFLKDSDVPLEKNPKLKSHALKVFVIICEAATSLRNKGHVSTPGSTMKDMAHSHMVSGVVMEHYEVVRFCLLKTLEEGLPAQQWNEEVKEAWSVAYDELVDAINAEAAAASA